MGNTGLVIRSFFDSFETTLQVKVYTINKKEYFSISYGNQGSRKPLKRSETGYGKTAVSFLYDRNFDLYTTLLIEDSESIVKDIRMHSDNMEAWLPLYNLAHEILQNDRVHPYYYPLGAAIVNAYKCEMRNASGERFSDDYFKKLGQSYISLKEKLTKFMWLFDQNENAQAVTQHIFETEPMLLNCPLIVSTEFVEMQFERDEAVHQLQSIVYPRTPEDFFYCLTPKYLESNLRFKRCENCMRYFVTTSQSNARFCEHVHEGTGRTCRQLMPKVHLLEKSQKDPAEWLYNRAYKTMYSRVTSGTISKESYKEWSKAARAKRNECSKGVITPEEYSSWLCDSGLFIDYLRDN